MAHVRKQEIRDAGDIVGNVVGGGVALIEGLHSAIAARAFGSVGTPAKGAHDSIANAAYGTVTAAGRGTARVIATAASLLAGADAPPLSSSPKGSAMLGALNGLWGDHLTAGGNTLAFDTTIRMDGADLRVHRASLAAAYPTASGTVVVFIHGLCETDESWHVSAERQQAGDAVDFGERLASVGDCSPIYLRYNSGRHVSDSGAAVADLLDEIVAAWPRQVSEIILIGHSMGGLVARSACHHGEQRSMPWVPLVRHVVCLGTPHLGAPLEKATNMLSWALHRLPETKGLATVLNTRSVGVKDLRFGSLLEQDWHGVDADDFLSGRASEVPFLGHAAYYFVAVTVSRDPRHPLGMLLGDLLVQLPSAAGKGRRRQLPFDIDKGRHIGGLNHFQLLTHPDVYRQLEHWLVAERLTTSGTNQGRTTPTALEPPAEGGGHHR